jgi:DNA-binding NarL/FixJ family response regulator
MSADQPRALIVEDDRSWQQILAEILTDAGVAVDVVDGLDAAVAALRAAPHRLAVVDLALGSGEYDNQDGLSVLEAVRRQDPGCVSIMLTGFATVELAVSALTRYGAFTCLRKEAYRRDQFRALVRQALASAAGLQADGAGSHPDEGTLPDRGRAADHARRGAALVVEDDAGWRSILSELLHDAGYQVRLCGSYGDALGCLRRRAYAVAVIDLSLSGMLTDGAGRWASTEREQGLEGYQLLASTRASGVPTIVVSGVATPDEIQRAYSEQGIFGYLEKQAFSRQGFLQMVEEAQAARRPPGELLALTGRERQVLELLARGLTNKEIAEALVITTNTVKRHMKAIFDKLEVHTRAAAAARAIGAGVQTDQVTL